MTPSLSRALAAPLLVCWVLLSACGPQTHPLQIELAGRPVQAEQLTAAEVRGEVRVDSRDGRTVYRAPTLSVSQVADLRRGTMVMGSNLGKVQLAASGYLIGSRQQGDGPMLHRLVYHWDIVEGRNRYANVALPDGRALRFRTTAAGGGEDTSPADAFPIIETLLIDVPDDELRAAAPTGLALTVTLDNGHTFSLTAPPAYIQGYLEAVDSPAS